MPIFVFFCCLSIVFSLVSRPILLRLRSGPLHMPQCGEPTGRSGCVSACANQQQIATNTVFAACVHVLVQAVNSLLSLLAERTDTPIHLNISICDCLSPDTANEQQQAGHQRATRQDEGKKSKSGKTPRAILSPSPIHA